MSIGNTENKQINIEDKQIPIKIIYYDDKLTDFGFDNKNMQMKFVMPFNWNQSRLNKSSIFVHEEISVPKPNAFTMKGSYIGKVNGMDISKDVMLDNPKPNQDIIHLIIPKNSVIQLADQMNKNGQAYTGLMKFDLGTGNGIYVFIRFIDGIYVSRQVMVYEKEEFGEMVIYTWFRFILWYRST